MPRLFSLLLILLCPSQLARGATAIEGARALFDTKKYSEARTAFEKLAADDPSSAEARLYLGRLAEKRGDNTEAIRQLEQAAALAPGDSSTMLELGGAYGTAANKADLLSKIGWAKKAGAALQKAVDLDPDNLAARNGLITFDCQAPAFVGGGISKAYEQAEEIRRRDPLMGAAVLGQLYLSEKKHDLAFATYEQALKTAPDNYGLLYGIGRAAAQTGQHLDEGEKALRRCLELKPKHGDPGYAPVQWRLGNIAEKRGDIPAARSAYQAALKIDPAFKQAADSLANLR